MNQTHHDGLVARYRGSRRRGLSELLDAIHVLSALQRLLQLLLLVFIIVRVLILVIVILRLSGRSLASLPFVLVIQ